MEQILKLENTDDLASIRGRVNLAFPPRPVDTEAEAHRPARLLLIVPDKNKTLQSLVNMKLLARLARTKAIEMAIVSGHPLVRDYAREVGVKAYTSLNGAKRAGWVAREAPVTPSEQTVPPVVSPPADPSATEKVKPKKYRVIQGQGGFDYFQQVGALLLLVLLAFALVLGVIALLPEATVTITPIAQAVETNLIVQADPTVETVDFRNLTFPARIDQVELDLSSSIETVETELAPVGRASGPVVFINRTDEAQLIPISTTVSTSAGEPIQFVTVQSTTIPPGVGATATSLVIAMEPGPGGNVQPGQINRFQDSVYGVSARALNETGFGGGTMEAAKIVVEADKERLQTHLQEEIRKKGLTQLEALLAEQEFVPADSLQVIVLDVSYEQFSGDFSDTFAGEMQAVVRGTIVGGYNANRLALAALEAQVPPGYELDIEGLHFGAGEVLDMQGQVTRFRIVANGMVVPKIDPTAVAEEIAWLPVGEAQAQLSETYNLATVPGVELGPQWAVEWLGRLPFVPLRINVVINDAVTLVAAGGTE